MAWAKPQRFVTLTQAPEDWQALRQRLRTLSMKLRRDGYRWEVAWTVEKGTKTGMKHIHLLQHGDYIPQQQLQERWGRIVDIRAIRGRKGGAAYAMKEATKVGEYTLKANGGLQAHLDLNGGRAVHLSRGYLHGKTTPEVEQLLRNAHFGQQELTWRLENIELGLWRPQDANVPPA